MRLVGWVAIVVGLGACETPIELIVDIESEVEASAVDRVVSTLDGIVLVERPIAPGDDLGGLRVAEFDDVPLGVHDVRACLHAGSVVVGCAEREVRLSESAGVTLEIAADCGALGCPTDSPCASGRCESLECSSPADCVPPVICATAACAETHCSFSPSDELCDGGRCDLRTGCIDAPSIAIEASAMQVPSGGALSLALRPLPAGEWEAGTRVALRVSAGVLEEGQMAATELVLAVDAAGMLPSIRVVARGVEAGTDLVLSSDATLTGATVFSVEPSRLEPVTIDSVTYEVLSGYALDAPLALDAASRSLLSAGVESMAITRPTTSFEPGAYFAIASGGPPMIYRSTEAGPLELFASNDGVAGPDQHAQNIVFAPSGAGYGDHLFLCADSPDAGDGVYTVDPGGRFERFLNFNNCQGIAFDAEDRLGDFGAAGSIYAVRQVDDMLRIAPDRTFTVVGTRLPVLTSGNRVTIPQLGSWAGSMVLSSRGATSTANDGALHRVDDVDPWAGAVLVRNALPDPEGAVAGADAMMPDFLFVPMSTSGELDAFSADGSYFTVVRGLDAPAAIALDTAGSSMWIVERGRGQVLRIRVR